MPKLKILYKVELPLALPVITAGIQTSAILAVGTATIAHLIGAGGLGRLIFSGISMNRPEFVITGSILSASIAIFLDQIIGFIQRRLTSRYTG